MWQPDKAATPAKVPIGYPSYLNPDATVAVYQRDGAVYARHLETGVDKLLIGSAVPLKARFTADGKTVYFTGPAINQLTRVNVDGSDLHTYTFLQDLVVSFAISGDGQVAFVSFPNASVTRIFTKSEHQSGTLPSSPNISQVEGALAPGSLLRIRGGGFPDDTAPNAPYSVEYNGVSVDFGVTRGRIVAVNRREILAQVTWSLAGVTPCNSDPDPYLFHVRPWTPANTGPWDAPEVWLRSDCNTAGPVPGSPAATHENGEVVTRENPAHPNEVIRIFGAGLGPVDQQQEDGVPAPAGPPVLAVSPYPCGATQVAPVALVPGRVGLFAASIRNPATAVRSYLACFAGAIPVIP